MLVTRTVGRVRWGVVEEARGASVSAHGPEAISGEVQGQPSPLMRWECAGANRETDLLDLLLQTAAGRVR